MNTFDSGSKWRLWIDSRSSAATGRSTSREVVILECLPTRFIGFWIALLGQKIPVRLFFDRGATIWLDDMQIALWERNFHIVLTELAIDIEADFALKGLYHPSLLRPEKNTENAKALSPKSSKRTMISLFLLTSGCLSAQLYKMSFTSAVSLP